MNDILGFMSEFDLFDLVILGVVEVCNEVLVSVWEEFEVVFMVLEMKDILGVDILKDI